MSKKHAAVRWDGKKILGGPPIWLCAAVERGPITPNGVCRVHEDVHVFGPRALLCGVAKPGDWILLNPESGELSVQTTDQMISEWKFRDGWFWRQWAVVTAATHPRLHAAFEIISHDRGSGAGHATYSVPQEWVGSIDDVESYLVTLVDADLQTLCIGEESDMMEIVRREGTATSKRSLAELASEMLNAFFEDWEVS